MNTQLFYEALSGLNDKYITEAIQYRKKQKNTSWIKWAAAAACTCLIISVGTFLFTNTNTNMQPEGGNSGSFTNTNSQLGGGNADGSGHDEATAFMSYAGPLFPLTTLETAGGIEAERNINFDFSSEKWKNITVHDVYTLTNTTDRDITVTALYPYASSFYTVCPPTVTVDGVEADATLHSGMYNLGYDISSWEDYKALFADGSYMKDAFEDYPVLDERVTVYRISDVSYEGDDPLATAPTLNVFCNIDYDKTAILTYGFNGGSYDREKGYWNGSFFVEGEWWNKEMDYYMIVVGDDIGEYTVQGYRNGGCYPYDKIDGVSANVERYETTFCEILKTITGAYYEFVAANYDESDFADNITFDMYYGELCRFFDRYGIPDGYPGDRLEEISMATTFRERVLYHSFELTVPAGGSSEICINLSKEASYDFYGAGSENTGVEGYDMVTSLGSTLNFTAQSASLVNLENVEIIRQNFGFHPENGVIQVELDLSQEHYYLEIKRIKNK